MGSSIKNKYAWAFASRHISRTLLAPVQPSCYRLFGALTESMSPDWAEYLRLEFRPLDDVKTGMSRSDGDSEPGTDT